MPITKQEAEVVKQGRALEAMIVSEGWKTYTEIMQSQVDNAATEVMKPPQNLDDIIVGEGAKGVFRGLRLAMTLPSVTITMMKEILSANQEQSPNG